MSLCPLGICLFTVSSTDVSLTDFYKNLNQTKNFFLPSANTALDAERRDCIQTGFPVQIPEPVKACHQLYFEIHCF